MSNVKVPISGMIGKTFGMLTVLYRENGNEKCHLWCRCECGKEKWIYKWSILRGRSTSCGCFRDKVGNNRTHGQSGTSEHNIWMSMIARCMNINAKDFKEYGGRGIRVCERWLEFESFIADMGPKPTPQHSVDRFPDQNGNYEPGNVRWATPAEQTRNKRNNVFLEFDGKRMILADWANYLGIPKNVLWNRVRRRKLPIEKALSLPYKEKPRRKQ